MFERERERALRRVVLLSLPGASYSSSRRLARCLLLLTVSQMTESVANKPEKKVGAAAPIDFCLHDCAFTIASHQSKTLELEQHHAAASRAAWPSGSVADSIRLQLCQDAGSVPRPVVVDAHAVVAASQGTWQRHVGVTGVVNSSNGSNSGAGDRASGRRPPQVRPAGSREDDAGQQGVRGGSSYSGV